jgi:hypothetical protein
MMTGTHNVHVTQFVQPKVVNSIGSHHEISIVQLSINFLRSNIEFMQNPFLDEILISGWLSMDVSRAKLDDSSVYSL